MRHVENVGQTILLDGKPLSLVTRSGVENWIEQGLKIGYRYDQVLDPLSATIKYRCLYEKGETQEPFVLVNDPDGPEGGRVVLFDRKPDASPTRL